MRHGLSFAAFNRYSGFRTEITFCRGNLFTMGVLYQLSYIGVSLRRLGIVVYFSFIFNVTSIT